MTIHPRKDDKGNKVFLKEPHVPTPLNAWADPQQSAIVVPDGPMPEILHGVRFAPWIDAPKERGGWLSLAKSFDFHEPEFDAKGMTPASGAVIVEPDGRAWLVAPSNAFGGYKVTYPKGKSKGMDMRATALKEVYEESGLQVELFDHLIDITKTGSRTRYYLARRIGGTPADMCWESQAVILAPLEAHQAKMTPCASSAMRKSGL